MQRKRLGWVAAAGALAFCAGCNLFNPSGPEKGASDDDAAGLVLDGTALLREDKPADALVQFQKAIAADPTLSEAWAGAAKAALAKGGLNVLTVISIFAGYGSSSDDSSSAAPRDPTASLPFANVADDKKTDYLMASLLAHAYLDTLIRHGSLPTHRTMDTVVTPKMVSCDFIAVTVIKTLLSFYDLNGDTVIDQDDRLIMNLLTGNFQLNPDSLGNLRNDTTSQRALIGFLRHMADTNNSPILGAGDDIMTIAGMFSGDSSALPAGSLDSLGFSAFTDSLAIGINGALDSLDPNHTGLIDTNTTFWQQNVSTLPKVLSGIGEGN